MVGAKKKKNYYFFWCIVVEWEYVKMSSGHHKNFTLC